MGEHYLSVPPTADAVTVAAAVPAVAAAVDAVPPAAVDVEVGDLHVVRLRQLAEQGNASAQRELGERYEEGRGGVALDYREAVAWYRRAAAHGDVRGQGNLGAMYANGTGVPPDNEPALMWFPACGRPGRCPWAERPR